MKTKSQFAKTPKLWILLLSLVLFTYCQKDTVNDTIVSNIYQDVLQMRYIAPSEIVNNQALSDKLKDIKRSHPSELSRTIYNSDHDMFIETDHVKFMESPDGVFHSYTFPITKDSTEQSIRNLVLFSYNNEPYESAIINYYLSESQLEELNETDHVSSTYTVEVESLDDDLSSLLSRDDFCDYVAVTYHVTPDTQETWVFDENSVCQHIDPESGETECFVHTITYLDCPDSVDGSGTTTDDGNNPDWTWSYTGGGSSGNSSGNTKAIGSSPSPPMFTKMFSIFINSLSTEQQDLLNSSIEFFNFKLDLQNFFQTSGYTPENEDFATELINTLMENPTFSFNETMEYHLEQLLGVDLIITDSDDTQTFLNFDSIQEIHDFIEDLTDSVIVDSNDFNPVINNQDGTTVTNFKYRFNTVIPLYMNVNVLSILDNPETTENDEFSNQSINSFLSGGTIAIDWEQVSFFVSSENENTIEHTIHGHLIIGFKYKGVNISYTENWVVRVLMNKNSGEAISITVTPL